MSPSRVDRMSERKAINDSLIIIKEYQDACDAAKSTLEYHAIVNPHKTLEKVKACLEKVK